MDSIGILNQVITNSNKVKLDYEFVNENLKLISDIPDSESKIVRDELSKIINIDEKLIVKRDVCLWELFIDYLFDIEEHKDYVLNTLRSALKNPTSKLYKDKEYICESLMELGDFLSVIDFLRKNPDYENHYLIEKIITETALSNYEIGNLIDIYLNHHYGIVRDAALQYLGKKKLCGYMSKVVELIKTEKELQVIYSGIKFLKTCGCYDIYEDIINQRLSFLKEKYQV